ncbi:MAG: mechanosensitive ion channel [bacterium]|nr:mechanosensitive ion channel [bacterium]MCM1375003.1 mechanosensitive ion channel [Muribaculum sp.]
MDFLRDLLEKVLGGVGAIVAALLILLVAFVVASIVKSLVLKLVDKTKLKDVLTKADTEGKPGSAKEFIGKLVYLLVFLLFVPAIFSVLGLGSVMSPINNILDTIWGYVPNIVAAGIVLVVGNLIAKLVSQLLVPVFDKLNINKLQEKAGIEVKNADRLSNTLAYIVYVLILIPTVVMALNVLNITVISGPAIGMLNTVISFIPSLVIGLIIIVIGCMIGKLAGQIVTRLIASAGLDAKLQGLLDEKAQKFVLSKVTGGVVYAVVVIFFVVEGLNVLRLDVLTDIGSDIIGFMPTALAAVLILAATMIVSSMVEKALRKNGMNNYAVVSKVAIIIVGVFMILSQLHIASAIVNEAFTLILSAVAIAFAIAFGIGGKEFAAKTLKKLEEKKEDKKEEKAE